MGYRNYIASIPKREYNKIKSLTEKEMYDFYKTPSLDGEGTYKGVYTFGKALFNFGKYTEFNPPKKSMKHFFKKKELQETYSENEFYVVNKEFLAYLIENYTNKIKAYYKEMLSPFFTEDKTHETYVDYKPKEFLNSIKTEYGFPDNKYKFDFSKITDDEQTAFFKIIEHIRSFASEWGINTPFDMLPYNLERKDEITTSWKFEYEIFELVRIYKSFDWKRNVMFYYGY